MKKIVSLVALALVSCGTSNKNSEKNSLYEVLTQQSNGVQVFVLKFFQTDQIAMLQNDENLKIKLIQMMFRLLIF
jgi:hypothetical protein